MTTRRTVRARASTRARDPQHVGAPRAGTVDVFDYLNYRAFLRDYYVERKLKGKVSFRSFTLVRLIFLPSSLLVCIRWHQLTNLSCPWQDSVEAFRWDTIWNKIVVLNVVIFVLEGFKG